MWDSVAMHQRIHEFLHPAPIGILSAHELSLQCKVYCVECCVTLSSWSPQRQCSRLQRVNTHTQKNTFRYHTWMHTLDACMLKHCTWMHMSFWARSFNPPKHNPPLTHTDTHSLMYLIKADNYSPSEDRPPWQSRPLPLTDSPFTFLPVSWIQVETHNKAMNMCVYMCALFVLFYLRKKQKVELVFSLMPQERRIIDFKMLFLCVLGKTHSNAFLPAKNSAFIVMLLPSDWLTGCLLVVTTTGSYVLE